MTGSPTVSKRSQTFGYIACFWFGVGLSDLTLGQYGPAIYFCAAATVSLLIHAYVGLGLRIKRQA